MVRHLIKVPFTALIFAALWHFAMTLAPVSQGYAEVLGEFTMPLTGYAFMTAYGLWLSVIMVLVYTGARNKGVKLFLLTLISFTATQWLTPMLFQLRYGETTGVMTFTDTIFRISCGAAATLLLLTLAAMLFKPPPSPPDVGGQAASQPVPEKYRIAKLRMAIILIVLPVIYSVIYFLTWYFLLWRSDPARAYYSGPADMPSFGQALVSIILTDARQIPMALIRGLAYELALLPMLIELCHRRARFMAVSVTLLLGVALQMLIPGPLMDGAVRMTHLSELVVELTLYGIFVSILLRAAMREPEVSEAAPAAKAAAPAAPAAPAKK